MPMLTISHYVFRPHVVLAPLAACLVAACFGGSSPSTGDDGSGSSGADGGTSVTPAGAVTYYKDVLPIVQAHCQKCHVDGGIAPFALTTYDDAKNVVGLLVDATQKRTMPPWGAADTTECAPPKPWKDDMRLADAQIATLKAWQDGGALAGDPKDGPAPRAPDATDLTNATFSMTTTPYTLTQPTDEFRCFVIDPKLAQATYFNGAFFIPGNKSVVHHVLLFSDPQRASEKLADATGQYDCFGGARTPGGGLLAAWAPGGVPMELPANVGTPLAASSLLVMQIHYHPHSAVRNDPDQTKVQLRFTAAAPDYIAVTSLIGNFNGPLGTGGDGLQPGPNDNGAPKFLIPANVSGHTETMRFTMPASQKGVPTPQVFLYSVGAHMHLVGVDEKLSVHYATPPQGAPADQCLLQVPQWNFNWQRAYVYDTPIESLPVLHPGDQLTVRCGYDNTMKNPALADALSQQSLTAPRDVKLGETTLDEMCLGAFTFLAKAR